MGDECRLSDKDGLEEDSGRLFLRLLGLWKMATTLQ